MNSYDEYDNYDQYDELDNDKFSALEELTGQALLVEMVNAKKAEVFENVVFDGERRYYIQDLTERSYSLENCAPYQLEVCGVVIEEHAWGNLLCKMVQVLLDKFPEKASDIYSFHADWSKQEIFTTTAKTNSKMVKESIYLNCNHTALHSCWLLQQILDFFNVDKATVKLLIHKPCGAEPEKVRDYIIKRFKSGFTEFLMMKYKKSEEKAKKVLDIVEKYLNPMLCKISKTYTNFFLFDDKYILSNYVKVLKEKINSNLLTKEKIRIGLCKHLDYLKAYYMR